jgi:hypothetical protein
VTAIIQGTQLATVQFGSMVRNASPKTVPANTTSTIFTVTGGSIFVTGLFGVVTTAITGTTPALKLVATPTTGTANDMCTALTVTSAEVGALFSLPSAVGSALNGAPNKSGSVSLGGGQLVAAGTIGANTAAADAAGAIRWTLFYVPLDGAATVTAA